MEYLVGVLVVLVGVAVSIALHEVGHLVPAKRSGVKVTQYMVGFGPTVWSRQRGETEYGVKAIPLGGYIRMIGMFPPAPGSDGTRLRASSRGRLGTLVESAREQSMDEVRPEDAERVFWKLPVRRKLMIMLGGPLMNLVIAVVLLGFVTTTFGVQQLTARISSVSTCVIPVGEERSECLPSDQAAPAAGAGILPDDRFLEIGGREVTSWDVVQEEIRASGGEPLSLVVERDGARQELVVTPIVADRPVFDDEGEVVLGEDGQPATEPVGFLGVSPTAEFVPQPLSAVPGLTWDYLVTVATAIVNLPERLVGVAEAAFGSGERDPEGPVSIVGVGRFAGEITSADVEEGSVLMFGVRERVASLLSLLVGLNFFLFAFNLVPLLPLDGGHVAGALWEGLRRRVASLAGRPDPGPVDVARLLPLTYVVALLLMGMSALLIYADIVRPIRLLG